MEGEVDWTWMKAAVDLHPEKWKLYRAVYDHYGRFYVEGSWPKERFEEQAANGGAIKYILGVRIKQNRHYIIKAVAEGPENCLRYILELIGDK